MKNRRTFLGAVASGGVTLSLLAKSARAQSSPAPDASAAAATPAATASATPAARASATPARKPASAVAVALAAVSRTFDARLTDADLASIARDIDDNRGAGAALNPKRKRLANGEEPVTHFAVPLFGANG